MIRKAGLVGILAVVSLGFAGCRSGSRNDTELDPVPAPARTEAPSNPEINVYIAGLNYDPRVILSEQVGDTVFQPQRLPDETQDDGEAIIICRQVKRRLTGNVDDVLILDPTHAVIWPGALVKADEDLVRGTPTPIGSSRAPAWLSIDLPGIGGRGVFCVDSPTFGTVQAAIDRALDYWNDHQYREGYVNKSRSKYTSTIVYSAEQLAASLGVRYSDLQKSLSTQFQITTSRENKVAMVLFKQVFYTVTFDPPSRPGAVFAPSVTLDEVRSQMGNDSPPAYVSSVDFGRILMLRIETSADTLNTELEGAMKYMGAKVDASAAYQKTIEKCKFTLITIGGNAEVNVQPVGAAGIKDLNVAIQGKNALYSKNNPGQPISYTVRFLKNGRLAKMGYSTDYTELTCERHPHGWVGFKNSGAYVAKFYADWIEDGKTKTWSSGRLGYGNLEKVPLKGNARNINISAQADTGFGWQNVFKLTLDGPPNKYYVVRGTTLNRSWGTADR